MRSLMRGSLKRALSAMRDEDRLSAAWLVACGRMLAERGTVVGYEDGVVRIEVVDATWLRQMLAIRGQFRGEMARIAGVEVREIHFEVKGQRPRAVLL